MKSVRPRFALAVVVVVGGVTGCSPASFDVEVRGEAVTFSTALFGISDERATITLGTVGCDVIESSDLVGRIEKYNRLIASQEPVAATALDAAAADVVEAHNEVFPIDSWSLQLVVPIDTETSIEIVTISEVNDGTGDGDDDNILLKDASFGNFAQKRKAAKNTDGLIDFGTNQVFTLRGEMSVSRFETTTDGGIAMEGSVGYADASVALDEDGESDDDSSGTGYLQFSASRCTQLDG